MRVSKTKIFADVMQDVAIVHFTSTHVREASDVNKISSEIAEIAENYDIKKLVINFARLQQITSSFLGKLTEMKKQLAAQEIKLCVCAMNKDVENAFKICRLQKLIPYFKSEKEAIK